MRFLLIAVTLAGLLSACATDTHTNQVYLQKVRDAVNAKYAGEKNVLMYVDAPNSWIADRFAVEAVEDRVNNGRAAAIAGALAMKSSVVAVVGENEALTAATLKQAFALGKDNINGAKAVVVGLTETRKAISDAASSAGVTVDFIDNPH